MFSQQQNKSMNIPVHVLDFYLFINPIDTKCHSCASNIMQFANQLKQKTYFHFIPYHNLQTITNYLKKYNLPLHDLKLRNQIYDISYLIALTYKAAALQGKKKAIHFFELLTSHSKHYRHDMKDEDIIELAKQVELDIDMLIQDRQSAMTQEDYKQDLMTAAHFSITRTPSIVIFDSLNDSGLLIEDDLSIENIEYALQYHNCKPYQKNSFH